MKRTFFWMMVLGLAFSAGAFAKNQGKGNSHGKGNPHNMQRDNDHDREDHGRWESRNGWEYRSYDRDQRPPGWRQGKKTGWGNCNLPPGQAKKYGCNTYVHEGRRYYWYRDDGGRIIIRRPIISAHVGIDIH